MAGSTLVICSPIDSASYISTRSARTRPLRSSNVCRTSMDVGVDPPRAMPVAIRTSGFTAGAGRSTRHFDGDDELGVVDAALTRDARTGA